VTEQEQKFCNIFLETGDEMQAVMESFGIMAQADARDHAQFLLARRDIKEAVTQAIAPTIHKNMTPQDVVPAFSDVAREAVRRGDFSNANRALENIGKLFGLYDKKADETKLLKSEEELDEAIKNLSSAIGKRPLIKN